MENSEKVKIAICDDDSFIGEQLQDICVQELNKRKVKYEIWVTNSAIELCEKMKEQEFDLLFLDIELPKMDGIVVGRYIRETLKDEKIQIVYISVKEQYAMELFDWRPLNFLVKPLDNQKVRKVLDKFLFLLEETRKVFTYKRGGEYHKIFLEDIIYFEKIGKKICVHTINGKNDGQFYGKMDDVYSKLENNRFLYIHKSIIVNYNYIVKFEYEQVRMIDGVELSISQSKRKEIRAAFMQLLEAEI